MSDFITTYNLDDRPDIVWPMDRKEFYKGQVEEYKKSGRPSKAIAVVNIFLFNEHGELFVQKRSNEKAHNPGLLDKSIGGHIQIGDSPQYTVMVETVQELQVPSVTLSKEEFEKTHTLLKPHLNTVAIVKYIDSQIANLEKVIAGQTVSIANRYFLYFGVYSGSTKTVDRESKGVLQYSIPDLEKEIELYPAMFTADLKFYLKKYKKEIEEFVKSVSTE